MCNEFRFQDSLDEILRAFRELQIPLDWDGGAPNLEPRASIRPTDPAYILTGHDGTARLSQMRWGFPGPKGPIINFRTEGRTFSRGRCLVPADGFFEFTGTKAPKSKWEFTAANGGFLGLAGFIRDDRFSLLTTTPGPDLAPYHDRQVVILPRPQWAQWLDTAMPAPVIDQTAASTLKVVQIR